ncbi:uncharacterized protein LOC110897124 [Helianthus annuus]|uniref:uncharacterized protein LOC110897124 n=1 Tax=Helianthus annuus TaxID=4232 RepID=UPI000B909477|nr:uncharacterized protein LOC110897124 [Helianthus annuus]
MGPKHLSHSREFCLDWNKWVPTKVNIFAWGAEMERLPTSMALSKRNIQLPSLECNLCNAEDETMEHLLTTCYVATRIWQWVAAWCNIPYIMAFLTRDLMEYHMYTNLSKDKSKVVHAVLLTASLLGIWRARNNLVFSAKPLRME